MMPSCLKISVLACLLMFLVQSSKAQQQTNIYLEGGLDNANIIQNGKTIGSPLTNPFLGLNFMTPPRPLNGPKATFTHLRLGFEAGYATKGSDFNEPVYKHRLHYANVALKPSVKMLDAFSVHVGGRVSHLLTHITKAADNINDEDLLIRSPRAFEISGLIGIEARLGDEFRLFFDYNRAFTPIEKNLKHSWFRIGLKYRLSESSPELIDTTPDRETRKAMAARNHIRKLKDGLLLVRLKSRRNKIRALLEKGMQRKAAEIYWQAHQRNKTIRQALQDSFRFTQVCFFYDFATEPILNRNWREHLFKADSTAVSKRLARSTKHFYVLDIGETFLAQDKQSFKGAVVRDSSLSVLPEPFPNKIPTRSSFAFLGIARSPKALIDKLDEKLWEFYR